MYIQVSKFVSWFASVHCPNLPTTTTTNCKEGSYIRSDVCGGVIDSSRHVSDMRYVHTVCMCECGWGRGEADYTFCHMPCTMYVTFVAGDETDMSATCTCTMYVTFVAGDETDMSATCTLYVHTVYVKEG
jgi:hypothetical protein